jgi:Ca2+-transporting ATPase
MFTATLLGWPSPLLAIQILWINLVTDGLPALALASEPLSKGLMERPPRRVDQPILSWENGRTMLFHGVLMACVTLFGFWWVNSGPSAQLERSRAVAFCILTFTQIFYSMACRDFNTIMPKLGFFSNPLLVLAMTGSIAVQFAAIACPWSASLLGLESLQWMDVPFLLVLSIIPVTIVELEKIFRPLLRGSQNQETM